MSNITAHMVVQNEEQWVWYAIQSVLPFIEELLIFDTGSTDKTVEIIQTIKSKKIIFEEKGKVTLDELVNLRNEQIKRTNTEWFLLLDGDEVWSEKSLREQLQFSHRAKKGVIGIVVPTRVCVGDLHHVQDEKAGRYNFAGCVGHFNIRMYRKQKGFCWIGTYPLEAYCDKKGNPIQNDRKKIVFANEPYWHLSHLKRSSIDTHRKMVYEIGKKDNASLPSVFLKNRPSIVPSVDVSYSLFEWVVAVLRTPLVFFKRRLT